MDAMPIPFHLVDAFADGPFRGNPAVVVLLDRWRDDRWAAAVAAEMNQSETAFVHPREGGGFALRWFTPTVEVDLCGHATLATAHVLWLAGDDAPRLDFHTRSGLLTARRVAGCIELDLPAIVATAASPGDSLIDALGALPLQILRAGEDWLVELHSADEVRELRPDLGLLATLGGRGVIVTAAADQPECDFVSRFFAPACGIPEDPVTGSAHCALGPLWARRLRRSELVGHQVSARGGAVGVRVDGARVHLRGTAVSVARGELLI